MTPSILLGPPQIHKHVSKSSTQPERGFTENGSATFTATGNPCLDFFFHVVPDTPPNEVIRRLELAWNHDPLIALKLICNLRGVRGTGKSDKEGFYTSALWLHKFHPKTLASNWKAIADFGYFKDALEILYRLLEGEGIRKIEKQEWNERMHLIKEAKVKFIRKFKVDKKTARSLRLSKAAEKARKGLERYTRDPDYRFLHDRISDLFAELLKSDIELYNEKDLFKISLAAKWCPSLDSLFDRSTLMCESIARKIFPKDDFMEYQDLEDQHYAYRVRDRLRKEILVPLRDALALPEVYICAKKWDALPYNRVASLAMKAYKKLFYKHDEERFKEYLENVKSGKDKIAAGALLPHEIIKSLEDDSGADVAELQWARMVDDMSKKGKLSNYMAICDVSGSMSGTPMEVSVALGLLISELSEEPWKGRLITFSENPQLQVVSGDSLESKTRFIRLMDWGGNTDFQKVFDRILEVAVEGNLSEDQMIKRLFVFSHMEFDEASHGWDTDYEVIKRKFREKGFQKVPEIVFWNLRDSKATPVESKQEGVALVSGYSKNLMTLFLDNEGIMSPEIVMMQAISGDEYQKLVVFD